MPLEIKHHTVPHLKGQTFLSPCVLLLDPERLSFLKKKFSLQHYQICKIQEKANLMHNINGKVHKNAYICFEIYSYICPVFY